MNQKLSFRIIHRYLGFFLVGIMAVYAVSGIVMIFRDKDTFKREKIVEKQIKSGATSEELPELLENRRLQIERTDNEKIYFTNGFYDINSGKARFTVMELPLVLDKLTHFHKAKSGDPLFFLNIFFGISLLFFVVSSFWMFLPDTQVFRKGMFFVAGGILFALILLFL